VSQIIYRIIDANVNRLKEGLRVIEEWCRFSLDNKNYSNICKNTRHKIIEICQQSKIPFSELISARDTDNDVGVNISSRNEYERENIFSVLKANFNRVQESLRVLEEYSKIFKNGKPFETIRYEMYTLEKNIFSNLKKKDLNSNIYVLLTEELCELSILDCLQKLLESGAKLFQLREKNKSESEFYELGTKIMGLVKEYDGTVIVNDNLGVALAIGADGVHLGINDLPLEKVGELVPLDFIIGATVHDLNDLKVIPDRIDYIGIGPCFDSLTKPQLKSEGFEFIKEINDKSDFLTFCIGGIDLENCSNLLSLNMNQFAICSAIIGSSNPDKEYQNLLQTINESC